MLQNFLAVRRSPFKTGFMKASILLGSFLGTGLNNFGFAAGFFVLFITFFLGTVPFFILACLPVNSLTLKILLWGRPPALGITFLVFLLAISAPLSTSNPTGGTKRSSLS